MKSAAFETSLNTKSCRIHLEKNTTAFRYEKEMGHGHQMTSVVELASSNDLMFACSVKSSLKQYSSLFKNKTKQNQTKQ